MLLLFSLLLTIVANVFSSKHVICRRLPSSSFCQTSGTLACFNPNSFRCAFTNLRAIGLESWLWEKPAHQETASCSPVINLFVTTKVQCSSGWHHGTLQNGLSATRHTVLLPKPGDRSKKVPPAIPKPTKTRPLHFFRNGTPESYPPTIRTPSSSSRGQPGPVPLPCPLSYSSPEINITETAPLLPPAPGSHFPYLSHLAADATASTSSIAQVTLRTASALPSPDAVGKSPSTLEPENATPLYARGFTPSTIVDVVPKTSYHPITSLALLQTLNSSAVTEEPTTRSFEDYTPDPSHVISPYIVNPQNALVTLKAQPNTSPPVQLHDYPSGTIRQDVNANPRPYTLPSNFLTAAHFPRYEIFPKIFPHSYMYPHPNDVLPLIQSSRTCHEVLTTLQMYPRHNSRDHVLPYSLALAAFTQMAQLAQWVEYTHHEHVGSDLTRATSSSVLRQLASRVSQSRSKYLFPGENPYSVQASTSLTIDPTSGVKTFLITTKDYGVQEHYSDTYIDTYKSGIKPPQPFTLVGCVRGDKRVKHLVTTLNRYLKLKVVPLPTSAIMYEPKSYNVGSSNMVADGAVVSSVESPRGMWAPHEKAVHARFVDAEMKLYRRTSFNAIESSSPFYSTAASTYTTTGVGYAGKVDWVFEERKPLFLPSSDFVAILTALSRLQPVFDAPFKRLIDSCSRLMHAFIDCMTLTELSLMIQALGELSFQGTTAVKKAISKMREQLLAFQMQYDLRRAQLRRKDWQPVRNRHSEGDVGSTAEPTTQTKTSEFRREKQSTEEALDILDLARVLYGMAKLDIVDVKICEIVLKNLHRRIQSIPAVVALSILRSMTELDYVGRDLFELVATHIVLHMSEVIATKALFMSLVRIINKLGYHHAVLLSLMSKAVLDNLKLFSPDDLAGILRAFAVCRCYPRELFQTVLSLRCWDPPRIPKQPPPVALNPSTAPSLFPDIRAFQPPTVPPFKKPLVSTDTRDYYRFRGQDRFRKVPGYTAVASPSVPECLHAGVNVASNDEANYGDTSLRSDHTMPAYWTTCPSDPCSEVDIMYTKLYQAYLGFKLEARPEDRSAFTFPAETVHRLKNIYTRNNKFWGYPSSSLHHDVSEILCKVGSSIITPSHGL
eukprot:GHVQ01023236.1.p1 GENE.GHVQ01023236.1~~GHVQ01023236.1.p1  ORF type:complete len:1118 (+),score=107.19 GHVQ01023236.1:266-3619(+)